VWSSQPVQAGVGQVQGFANQQVDKLSGKLADQIRKVLGSLLGLDKGNIEVTVVATRPGRASTGPISTGAGTGTTAGTTADAPPASPTAAE
jgi:hypothetical protein